jgi:hypothetical protein
MLISFYQKSFLFHKKVLYLLYQINYILNMKNFRIIIKCQSGFLTIVDKKTESVMDIMKSFITPKTILTIEQKSEASDNYFTVFATKGSKVHIASKEIYDSNYIQSYWPTTDMNRIGKPVTEWRN